MKRVVDEIHVSRIMRLSDRALTAIGTNIRANIHNLVAIGQDLIAGHRRDVNRRDTKALQSEQLAALRDAVLIQISPDAQLTEARIVRIDTTVRVRVLYAESGESVCGETAVGQESRVTKEFAPAVDRTVTVAIEDQKAVIRSDPDIFSAADRVLDSNAFTNAPVESLVASARSSSRSLYSPSVMPRVETGKVSVIAMSLMSP
jgi:hypothetical protein